MSTINLGSIEAFRHAWKEYKSANALIRFARSAIAAVKGFFGKYTVTVVSVTSKMSQNTSDSASWSGSTPLKTKIQNRKADLKNDKITLERYTKELNTNLWMEDGMFSIVSPSKTLKKGLLCKKGDLKNKALESEDHDLIFNLNHFINNFDAVAKKFIPLSNEDLPSVKNGILEFARKLKNKNTTHIIFTYNEKAWHTTNPYEEDLLNVKVTIEIKPLHDHKKQSLPCTICQQIEDGAMKV